MDIRLRYGAGHLALQAPDRNVQGVYRPTPPPGDAPAPAWNPKGLEKLRAAATGRHALLLLPDGTRSLDEDTLAAAVSAFPGAASLTTAIATGSHRSDTLANRAIADRVRAAATSRGVPLRDVMIHDCRGADFGPERRSSRGHRIRLSNVLDEPDVVLVVSDVKHHYFAGYSNALKFFLPGLADFESIEANHRLALEPNAAAGRHPLHANAERRSNPVAEEMLEAFRLVWGGRSAFAMTHVCAGERVVHRDLDDLEIACTRAFTAADGVSSVCVTPAERVVISAGGRPQDATLYLCQRAVELTKRAIADGAEVLLIAECRDGLTDTEVAHRNFYLELRRPLPEVMSRIRDGYRLYQHKAYRFAELLQRVRVVHLTSRLDDEDVASIHFRPAPSAQAVVNEWLVRDPDCHITFLDEANRLTVTGAAA